MTNERLKREMYVAMMDGNHFKTWLMGKAIEAIGKEVLKECLVELHAKGLTDAHWHEINCAVLERIPGKYELYIKEADILDQLDPLLNK